MPAIPDELPEKPPPPPPNPPPPPPKPLLPPLGADNAVVVPPGVGIVGAPDPDPHPSPSTAQGRPLGDGGPEPGHEAAAGAMVPATTPRVSKAMRATRMGPILLPSGVPRDVPNPEGPI